MAVAYRRTRAAPGADPTCAMPQRSADTGAQQRGAESWCAKCPGACCVCVCVCVCVRTCGHINGTSNRDQPRGCGRRCDVGVAASVQGVVGGFYARGGWTGCGGGGFVLGGAGRGARTWFIAGGEARGPVSARARARVWMCGAEHRTGWRQRGRVPVRGGGCVQRRGGSPVCGCVRACG